MLSGLNMGNKNSIFQFISAVSSSMPPHGSAATCLWPLPPPASVRLLPALPPALPFWDGEATPVLWRWHCFRCLQVLHFRPHLHTHIEQASLRDRRRACVTFMGCCPAALPVSKGTSQIFPHLTMRVRLGRSSPWPSHEPSQEVDGVLWADPILRGSPFFKSHRVITASSLCLSLGGKGLGKKMNSCQMHLF